MITILVDVSDYNGCGAHRIINPHLMLDEVFPDEYEITLSDTIDWEDINYLKQFELVFIHKLPHNNYKDCVTIINTIHKAGCKLILDIDDYWELASNHFNYAFNKSEGIDIAVVNCIKLADLVTTTTELLALEIKRFNKKVVVLPNGINTDEEQFIHNPIKNDITRFGWCGGSSHLEDIKLLNGFVNNDMQLILAGFDVRGSITEYNSFNSVLNTRNMSPEETIWFKYENIVTNNYTKLNKYYVEYLKQYEFDPNYNDKFSPYRRIWSVPVCDYAKCYNEFDVALAPLVNNKFNNLKSPLKAIEAGFHKIPIIASNVSPYKEILTQAFTKGGGINNSGNALLVDKDKQWLQFAKILNNNPNMREDLGERLYESIKDKFDLRNITILRNDVYKQLINE